MCCQLSCTCTHDLQQRKDEDVGAVLQRELEELDDRLVVPGVRQPDQRLHQVQ